MPTAACARGREPFCADHALALAVAMREVAGTARLPSALEAMADLHPVRIGRLRDRVLDPVWAGWGNQTTGLGGVAHVMGFNAMQPGRIKRGDVLFLLAAIVVVGALLAWAFFGT